MHRLPPSLAVVLSIFPSIFGFVPQRQLFARYTRKAFKENLPLFSSCSLEVLDYETTTNDLVGTVEVFPAKKPLSEFCEDIQNDFSILSWNILLPNSEDNWWNHKMYSSWVPMEKREWPHRHQLIKDRLLHSDADIICIQEASGDTFDEDFAFLKEAGYDHCLHNKFRFRCATFFKKNKFALKEVAHKDRNLVTALQTADGKHLLNVVNCHLSGGAAPDRRLRQVYEGLDQIRKWKNKAAQALQKQRQANRPSPKRIQKAEEDLQLQENAGVLVCGDFNSDGNTGVRRFLVHGSVEPDWREPQYPNLQLTSKTRGHPMTFLDASELAYGANVCDGDYGEIPALGCRPATYVVPNLASLLLMPVQGEGVPRTEFGYQMARGIAETLGMKKFSEEEIDSAFDSLDLDGNDLIDGNEIQQLLETVYVNTYGRQEIERERKRFFSDFNGHRNKDGLTREQMKEKLINLQIELEKDENDMNHSAAKGITQSLGMHPLFDEAEFDRAFDRIDLDGNNLVDEDEIQQLLETVYINAYGRENIEKERKEFFGGFRNLTTTSKGAKDMTGLSRDQLKETLMALQQQLEGGHEGKELVEIRTELEVQHMIDRFTPILREALDYVFHQFSGNGDTLSQDEVAKFLTKTNGRLGRGGMWRHTQAMFNDKDLLNLQDWYGAFARELGEGKWWQVVYDLEVCGANLRAKTPKTGHHYQGWLDYLYFEPKRLQCRGVQEALTDEELSKIYRDGCDALPNAWHPSDHLPLAAVFSWQS